VGFPIVVFAADLNNFIKSLHAYVGETSTCFAAWYIDGIVIYVMSYMTEAPLHIIRDSFILKTIVNSEQ
jgi:hypothetical protein